MHQQLFVYGVKAQGLPLLLATIDVRAESVEANGFLGHAAREQIIQSVTKFGSAEGISHIFMQYIKPMGFQLLKEGWDLVGPREPGQPHVRAEDGRIFYLVMQTSESSLEFQV